jgi:NAD(P)H-nitrite reductase large subunit
MSTHFVIIGNGAAGYRAAKSLRRADGDAQVSIFTGERHPFYLRRQLGEFVAGNLTLPELIFQSRNSYRRERIDLFLMTPVERLDPDAHEVVFASGQRARYDRLLIATGTQAVPFDIPGTDLDGVVTFDTLTQAQEVKRILPDVRRAAILGEGIVGLTLAESLVARGIRVTQLVRGERFWPEMLDERASSLVEGLLEENGVELRRETAARAILGAGRRAIGVEMTDGETVPAELVTVGCRRRPAIDLVRGSSVEVGLGIHVDAGLRTSRPDVFAAGDVAEPVGSDEFGDEGAAFCWQRAWAQGGLAAASMLDQKAQPVLEAVRLRATVFGNDLAVIGHGHLAAGGNLTAVELPGGGGAYRRLIFEDDLLAGAIVLGTGESVHELNRLVAERAPRDVVETSLGLREEGLEPAALAETFASHCPICAAELVVYRGTRDGAVLQCFACSTDLLVRWDGQRGWLEIGHP